MSLTVTVFVITSLFPGRIIMFSKSLSLEDLEDTDVDMAMEVVDVDHVPDLLEDVRQGWRALAVDQEGAHGIRRVLRSDHLPGRRELDQVRIHPSQGGPCVPARGVPVELDE
jgi:hypothetical protein